MDVWRLGNPQQIFRAVAASPADLSLPETHDLLAAGDVLRLVHPPVPFTLRMAFLTASDPRAGLVRLRLADDLIQIDPVCPNNH